MEKSKMYETRSVILTGVLLTILSISYGCTKSSDSGNGGSNQPGANEVWMQNMAFDPTSITVSVGTTVKWTNKDSFTHNVTSSTGAFSSGSMASNATFSFQFNSAGTYNYSCTIHPGMNGTVIVQQSGY